MPKTGIVIPDDELELRAILSSGPGGQNVNKTATAVQLRFDVRNSPTLDDAQRARLEDLAGNRLSRDGVLILTARRQRTQEANRREVLARLAALVERAAQAPRKRIKTRVPAGQRRRRLEQKRRRGERKSGRRTPAQDY